jgi:hypothetical protein
MSMECQLSIDSFLPERGTIMAVLEEGKSQSTLSALEWLAVRIVGKNADAFRDEVQPGKGQDVDLLLRIQGKIDVFEDGTTTQTEKPKLDNLLGHIIKRLTPSDWEAIRNAIMQAIANDGTLPGCEEGYAAKAKMLIDAMTKRKSAPKKGATKGSFRVGSVDTQQLSPTMRTDVQRFTRAIKLEEVE